MVERWQFRAIASAYRYALLNQKFDFPLGLWSKHHAGGGKE
jgi:hypothetical protein